MTVTRKRTRSRKRARSSTAIESPELRVLRVADLFCGAGGSSTGALMAIQASKESARLIALNHMQMAIASHEANHPSAAHYCESIDSVTPVQLVPGGFLDLLMASPSCKPFSPNVNGRPVSAEERALCWHVATWTRLLRVERLIVENVPGFMRMGPLYPEDHPDAALRNRPIPELAGSEFEAFMASLRAGGYTAEARVLNAADYGVPQERLRLIILAHRSASPIRWPAPTHGPGGPGDSGLKPYITARDVLDLNDFGEVFTGSRSEWVNERVEQGLEQYEGGPFLLPRKQGRNRYVRSIDRPFPTMVASKPGWSIVRRERGQTYRRWVSIQEYLRGMSFPEHYVLKAANETDAQRLIGNAVPPLMAKALVRAHLYGEGEVVSDSQLLAA